MGVPANLVKLLGDFGKTSVVKISSQLKLDNGYDERR